MSDIQNRTRQYYEAFENAASLVDRQTLADDFKQYYEQLSAVDRAIADEVTKPYLANALRTIQEMEPALQHAKEMLERIHSQPA